MSARTYRIGTMGWAYEDWKGAFYPEKSRDRDALAIYAEHFDTVEVDSSFYGFPAATTIERWCRITPDHFRFCLKCPQEITHERELVDIEEKVAELTEPMKSFGEKLGMLLFQFPASFRASHLVRVKRLFDCLPAGLPFAIELRHPSWLAAGAPALAREYGVTWTVSDHMPELHITSKNLYLRLLGDHQWETRFDHVQRDVDDDVRAWGQKLIELPVAVTTVYGFVNNHYSGHSPATASRLRTQLGLEPIVIFRQTTLF